MKIESNLKPRTYNHNEVVRIINQKQQLLYIKNNVFPIDIYCSVDNKTNNSIIVMIFLKNETSDVYKKWCEYELN